MNIVGFVFARGGSKGVPRKNIRPVGGKPLIGHAIETALASRWIKEVVVSTDDPEIAAVARQFGASVPFLRPPELSGDAAPEWLAWRHAVNFYDEHSSKGPVDVFVSVPATSPLRIAEDVDRCVEGLIHDPDQPDAILTVAEPYRNPYFNQVTTDERGFARVVCTLGSGVAVRRQDAPPVYDITTVAYAVRAELIRTKSRIYDGRVKTAQVPVERSLDIDTEHDMALAEFLWQRREQLRRAA